MLKPALSGGASVPGCNEPLPILVERESLLRTSQLQPFTGVQQTGDCHRCIFLRPEGLRSRVAGGGRLEGPERFQHRHLAPIQRERIRSKNDVQRYDASNFRLVESSVECPFFANVGFPWLSGFPNLPYFAYRSFNLFPQ